MNSGCIRADWPAPSGIIAGTTLRNSEFELPADPQWLNQVHGIDVVRAGSADFADGTPEADAIVAHRGGDICVVKTADCLPVLLCSRDGQEIAAAHAGWRGLAAGVLEATIAAMSIGPVELMAWLGPAISQPAFEVGGEVRDAFLANDADAANCFVENARNRWQADLYGLARQRLRNAGVNDVSGGGLCTYEDESRFFSHRRDGTEGRLLSFVYRRV
jgi:hypothetical protein